MLGITLVIGKAGVACVWLSVYPSIPHTLSASLFVCLSVCLCTIVSCRFCDVSTQPILSSGVVSFAGAMEVRKALPNGVGPLGPDDGESTLLLLLLLLHSWREATFACT